MTQRDIVGAPPHLNADLIDQLRIEKRGQRRINEIRSELRAAVSPKPMKLPGFAAPLRAPFTQS
jgi:hypothetical protein